MIVIYNLKGQTLKSIPNGNEYFNHVSAGELLEDHPEFDKTKIHWSFVIYPPERVPDLYLKLKKEFLTPPIKEAFQKKLGLIEICKGDFINPTWVPITLDLDMGALKKDWYLDYCKKHGYIITENGDGDVSPHTTKAGGGQ